ncbi:hypothetical protein GDO81_011608 [Engystomops pustulosus]|uniref:Uncharacterized protein n=1 Tax=Engystomops pustulosus TaxID=76066 RepID=A0AAV7BFF7_ENGPU|nr:hypothetical protein GDO81_011608 [Engystomops pustulosus]
MIHHNKPSEKNVLVGFVNICFYSCLYILHLKKVISGQKVLLNALISKCVHDAVDCRYKYVETYSSCGKYCLFPSLIFQIGMCQNKEGVLEWYRLLLIH